MTTFKRFTLASSLICGVTTANAILIQSFELDTSGISVTRTLAGSGYNAEPLNSEVLVRADSSYESQVYLDIDTSSHGGNYFLEVLMDYEDSLLGYVAHQGDRVTWNGGSQVGSFQSGFGHRMDVYFDALVDDDGLIYNYANTGFTDGFYFQPTLLAAGNSAVLDAGGFGVQLHDLGSGNYSWRVVADGDSRGFSGGTGSFYDITTSGAGWYSMETIWVADGGAMIDQINTLYDESGSIVFTETIQDVAAVSEAGQIGAASLGNGDQGGAPSAIGSVAIDNLEIVPEPNVYSLLAGLVALSIGITSRRR